MIIGIIWLLVFATLLCFPIIFWKAHKKDEEISQKILKLSSEFSDYQQQVNEKIKQYRTSYDDLANAYQDYRNKVKDLLSSPQFVIAKQSLSAGDSMERQPSKPIATIIEDSNLSRK